MCNMCNACNRAFATAFVFALITLPALAQQGANSFVPGELIVGFKSAAALDNAAARGSSGTRGALTSPGEFQRLSDKEAKIKLNLPTRGIAPRAASESELQELPE